MIQSRNPGVNALGRWDEQQLAKSKSMTLGGTLSATAILLAIVATVGVIVWQQMFKAAQAGQGMPGWVWPALIGSFIATLGISFLIYAKPKTAPIVAPIHAGIEGVFVGALSFVIPMQFLADKTDPSQFGSGPMVYLVIQAILATFGIAAGMLLGYATGILRVGPFVQKVIVTMGMGLLLYVGALWILSMFGVGIWNGFADTGMFGIGFTALCVGLASLYLLLDFQFIEKSIAAGAPKYNEWVGGWLLMTTLVWLYIEVLRLLAKLQSRD